MTTTLADIKGRIKQMLQGYSRNQEQITWLTSDMSASDVTFNVDLATSKLVSRGLVEIDNELILVNTFNSQTGLVSVAANANGRGRENTTAASHLTNAIVTMDPDFPKQRITEALNDTIDASYPDLYVMKTVDFPYRAARYEYEMPADSEFIVRITDDTIGPSKVKFPNQTARFNPQAQIDVASGLSTGKSLQIFDRIVPGRTIHVVYGTKPGQFTSDSQDFETQIGLPDRVIDVMMFGACARLLSGMESARLQQKAVEATERAPLVPTGAATNAANYFWQLYYKRMAEEVDRQHFLFPVFQTFGG